MLIVFALCTAMTFVMLPVRAASSLSRSSVESTAPDDRPVPERFARVRVLACGL
jgi:hypothetical protein